MSDPVLASDCLGIGSASLPPLTLGFYDRWSVVRDYLDILVPPCNTSVGAFRVLCLSEIECNLSGISYSEELVALDLLPFAEFDNDKLCCIDCDFPGYIVLQLGRGTIQPLREFILFRAPSFPSFMQYMKWKNGNS
jgi:hypothetical protein